MRAAPIATVIAAAAGIKADCRQRHLYRRHRQEWAVRLPQKAQAGPNAWRRVKRGTSAGSNLRPRGTSNN
jgi:hypothetical protein